MKTLYSLHLFLFLALTIPLTGHSEEENSQTFGEYSVHYSIFPSTFLTADVARAYGIKRSKHENLINVFVSKEDKKGGVKVNINGNARNLMQQQQPFQFQEILEDDTVYYIAPFKVSSDEILHFEVICTLPDTGKELKVKFTKKIYKN